MNYDYEIKSLFEEHLGSDEEVEWCGTAVEKPTIKELGDVGFAWVFLVCWIIMITMCSAAVFLDKEADRWIPFAIWIIFNVPCFLIMWASGLTGKPKYCVTDRRLLILDGKKITSYELGVLNHVTFRASDRGVGHIKFRTPYLVSGRSGREFKEGGIYGVENVEEIFHLMIKGGATPADNG